MYCYDYYYNYYHCVRERERERERLLYPREQRTSGDLIAFPPNFKGKGLHILRAQEAVAFVLSSFALLEIRAQEKSSAIPYIYIYRTLSKSSEE